jgi:hypothetical protein
MQATPSARLSGRRTCLHTDFRKVGPNDEVCHSLSLNRLHASPRFPSINVTAGKTAAILAIDAFS